ncbi:MAG: LamG domain-containing protein, partial [Bacteroidota bacterium]
MPTPTAYTIEMWVKPNSTTDQGLFVRTDNGGEMSAFSSEINIHNGKFEHYLFDGNSWAVADAMPVVAGTWYHVVATATNNGQMRLFVNGAEAGTAVSIGTLWTDGDRYKIGVSHLGFFNGTLDEVRIWNSALDSTAIRQNMHRIFNSYTSGL